MENNKPVIDKTRLVTYVLPADGKTPMSEKALRRLEDITFVISNVTFVLGGVWGIFTVIVQCYAWALHQFSSLASWYDYQPYVDWWLALGLTAVAIVILVVSVRLRDFARNEGHYVYRYVPQGMITAKDTRGGGGYPLSWVLLVEGYNSRNELCVAEHTVTAGEWQDDYEIGGYVDIRDEEDKANSAFEPWVGFAPHEAS